MDKGASNVDILAFEDRRFSAMAANDLAALEELLPPELHYVHANGMVEDKAEFLRKLKSGERQYLEFRSVDRTACRDGEFTLVFGEAAVEVERQAGRLSSRLTYTAVYRNQPDIRFVAWHAVKSLAAGSR
jgi:hypothetical protein